MVKFLLLEPFEFKMEREPPLQHPPPPTLILGCSIVCIINFFIYFLVVAVFWTFEVEGGVHLPELLAPLAQLNKRNLRIATRGMRGPLLLKCHPVVYDADANRLSLPPGVFVGFDVQRDTKEEDHDEEEYKNTVIDCKESDLAGTAIFGENMDNSDCYGNTLKSLHSVQTRQNSSNWL